MSAHEVVVVDYGAGNLLSVQRGLEYCGATVVLTADPVKILSASHVVLPGVGAFANAMQALERLDLVTVLRKVGRSKSRLLGICLGMQLLLEESEEFGSTYGLGLIPGRVISIPKLTVSGSPQKIPHIGWGELMRSDVCDNWSDTLLQDIKEGQSTYFVHSYMSMPSDDSDRIADCFYGGHKVPAVIRRNQIIGCQFHPEKSGEIGLKILRRFIAE